MTQAKPILFLSDARGIYIPRDFACEVKRECVSGVDQETWDILSDPDHEWYWEAWEDVCRDARVTDPSSKVQYHVYQDGDCWLIPDGMVWDETREFYVWPDELIETGPLD